MVGRDNWPSMGQHPPEDIHEHGTILHANFKDLRARVQKKETMPTAITKQWLNEVARYLELTRNQPTQINVMDAIDKLTAKVNRNHKKIEEDTAVIRKTVTKFSLPSFSPSSIYSKNSSQSWSSIVSSGGASRASTTTRLKPAINKNIEIIVRLNDSEQKQVMQKTPSQDIVEHINRSSASPKITKTLGKRNSHPLCSPRSPGGRVLVSHAAG